VSDFAFKMSKRDRKTAMGEMVSPADNNYDPEGEEYPDPLKYPDTFVQKLLQEVNSMRREEEFEVEDLDLFESALMDFLTACSDENLGPEDLPGTGIIIEVMNSEDGNYNGISSVANQQKESAAPLAVIPAAGALLSRFPAVKKGIDKIKPYAEKGLQLAGLNTVLQNVPFVGDMFGAGGEDVPQAPIQTQHTLVASADRSAMPFDHIADNLMFESASGTKKRDEDIESLRGQVNAALTQWAKSGEVTENRAVWWALYSYSHEAETIAELSSILTAIPEEFHNAVLNSPVGLAQISPEEGNTGLPEPSAPSESLTSPSDTSMSPVPMDGVGTPPKMPNSGETLIPGAVAASHDALRAKPVFASVDESTFQNYAEEDRAILSRVAAFMDSNVHESEIINVLHPSFGHEYVIWAIEENKKVANNDPMVDPAIANLGIEWKEAGNDPHDLPEGMHQMNIMEVLDEVGKEKAKKKKEKTDNKFPSKGEHHGANPSEKINQQETSGMITPQQEKVAVDILMNQELQHNEDAYSVEPTRYLSDRLSYPYAFLASEVKNSGNFVKAAEEMRKIQSFVEDYVENYLDYAMENVFDLDEEGVMATIPDEIKRGFSEEQIADAIERAKEYFPQMAEAQNQAIMMLQERNNALEGALTELSNIMPYDVLMQNDESAMYQQLESVGVAPEEFNELINAVIESLTDMADTLHEAVRNQPGFGRQDQEKSIDLLTEQGVMADPRTIIKDPQDYELSEDDRSALNSIGIDFPRESKKKQSDFTSLSPMGLDENGLSKREDVKPYEFEELMPAAAGAQLATNALMQGVDPSLMQAGAYNQVSQQPVPVPDPGVHNWQQEEEQVAQEVQGMYPNMPAGVVNQVAQNVRGQNARRQQGVQTPASPEHPSENVGGPSASGDVSNTTNSALNSATYAKTAAWKDTDGNILNNGQMYKMTSSKYEVPDLVRVVNNGSTLDIFIPRGGIDVSLQESDIREANYQFEPVSQREASFLSESGLTSNEQKALINEEGTARNMDRLNLEGTHYPSLLQTSKNDTIDIEDVSLEDFFVEDLDLFL
jgi:hypothetical protein